MGDPHVTLMREQDAQEYVPGMVYVYVEDLPSERLTFYHVVIAAWNGELSWLELVKPISRANVPPEAGLVHMSACVHPYAGAAVEAVREYLKAPGKRDSLEVDACTSVLRMTFAQAYPREGDGAAGEVPSRPVAKT